MCVFDEQRQGQSIPVKQKLNQRILETMIQENWRIKQRDIILIQDTSQESAQQTIFHLKRKLTSPGAIGSKVNQKLSLSTKWNMRSDT